MSREELVAGVDSSTQSCTVELRSIDTGELRGTGSALHSVALSPVSEQHPEEWWAAFVVSFRQAVTDADAAFGQIVAIAVGAQCHGLVPLDKDLQVIRPAKLWNDTTASPQIGSLRARIGEQKLIKRIGSLPTSAFTLGKIGWLAEREPEHFAKLRHILLPHDYLTWRLTGRFVTDRSEASGTGYYDAETQEYIPEFLRLIDAERHWTSMLPEVLGPEEAAGTLSAEAAHELGLSRNVLVGPGGGDQHLSALGLGVRPGDVVYSFGTSGVVFSTQKEPIADPLGIVDGVADCAGGYLPLASTLNAAKVFDTFTSLLGASHAEMSELALRANPEVAGPVLAAFLSGERTPDRPFATGLLGGLTATTTREELARSVYEGVILGLVRGQKHMQQLGVAVSGNVIAVGGGARSLATRQLLADNLGAPVCTPDVVESVTRGAAVQAAAVVSGQTVDAQRELWMPSMLSVVEPRETSRDPAEMYRVLSDFEGMDGLL